MVAVMVTEVTRWRWTLSTNSAASNRLITTTGRPAAWRRRTL